MIKYLSNVKGDEVFVKCKGYDSSFNSWIEIMSQYFSKPFIKFEGNFNVKVDLLNYATKVDIKNISQVHTSSFALNASLASLKLKLIN